MPRCIVFSLDVGFCGTDTHEFEVFPDNITEAELDNEAWERALAHADSYGVYPESQKPDDYEEDDAGWNSDEYTDNIEGTWEDFDPEKHDGLVPGGGSATDLFKRLLKDFNE